MSAVNRIQRLPRGLLSLLDTKSLGKNPPSYEDELQLTLDTLGIYLPPPEYLVSNTNGLGIVAPADVGDIVVPNGELWVVRNVGSSVTATVGGGILGMVNMAIISGATTATYLHEQSTPTVAVGNSYRRGFTLPQLLYAPPGTTFRLRAEPVNGTASFANNILFHRLTI